MDLTIVQDTRQQNGKDQHIIDYFKIKGIKVIRTKLFVGDYAILNDMSVIVDRKKDLLEVASNIHSNEHERFKNELINAQNNNIKLYILIEDEYIYNLDGVKYYQVPRYKTNGYKNGIFHRKGEKMSQVNFETLGKAMKTMEQKYGCKFCFAKRSEFGQRVIDILTRKRTY